MNYHNSTIANYPSSSCPGQDIDKTYLSDDEWRKFFSEIVLCLPTQKKSNFSIEQYLNFTSFSKMKEIFLKWHVKMFLGLSEYF